MHRAQAHCPLAALLTPPAHVLESIASCNKHPHDCMHPPCQPGREACHIAQPNGPPTHMGLNTLHARMALRGRLAPGASTCFAYSQARHAHGASSWLIQTDDAAADTHAQAQCCPMPRLARMLLQSARAAVHTNLLHAQSCVSVMRQRSRCLRYAVQIACACTKARSAMMLGTHASNLNPSKSSVLNT